MSHTHYDFIIIGAGSAGLQLTLTLLKDPDFKESKILLLDRDYKNSNDKTWCFWEEGEGPYDDILYNSWEKGWFHSKQNTIDLDMGAYRYKMLRALDFYEYGKRVISDQSNVDWKFEEVIEVSANGTVKTIKSEYTANYIFDSRVPEEFQDDKKSIKLIQHFLGWVVQFEEDTFDDQYFTMMDFRYKMHDTTSFIYVLPFDKRTGLIEFTFFNEAMITEEEYESYLSKYLEDQHPGKTFEILDREKGVIPMTDFSFHKFHEGKITKIGTAGGWVKPSSGYSFKITQGFISKLLENIKSGKPTYKGIARGKNRFYDSIFLGILKDQNWRGEALFNNMYSKLPAHLILKFLDEKTKVTEDIKIMAKFTNRTFTMAFLKQLFTR